MIRLSLSVYNDVHSLYTKLYAHVANSSFFPVIEPRTTLYSFPPRSFHHRVRFACRNVLKHRRRPLRSNDTVAPKSSSDTRNPLVPRDFDFSLPLTHPFSLDERYVSVVPAPFSPCCSIRARFFLQWTTRFWSRVDISLISNRNISFY